MSKWHGSSCRSRWNRLRHFHGWMIREETPAAFRAAPLKRSPCEKYGVLHDKRNNTCKCGENVFFLKKKIDFFRPIGLGHRALLSRGRGVHRCIFFGLFFNVFSCCISVLLWLWQKTMLNKRCPCDQTPYRLFVISGLFIILLKNGKSLLWTVYIITVQKNVMVVSKRNTYNLELEHAFLWKKKCGESRIFPICSLLRLGFSWCLLDHVMFWLMVLRKKTNKNASLWLGKRGSRTKKKCILTLEY